MARQPLLAAVPPPQPKARKPRTKRGPMLNRNCSPERIAELRARLDAADNARPKPALRQEGPESFRSNFVFGPSDVLCYDLLDMMPLALRGGSAVSGRRQ